MIIEIAGIRPYIEDPEEGIISNMKFKMLKETILVESEKEVAEYERKQRERYQKKYPNCKVEIDTITIKKYDNESK